MANETSSILAEYDNAIHAVTVAMREMHAGKMHFGVKQCWMQPRNSAKGIPAQEVAHKQHEEAEAADYKRELNKVTADFNARHAQYTFWFTGAAVKTIPADRAAKPEKTPVHGTAVYHAPAKV